jgi:2,5-dihydroxypyridine 5,6-dioxygenase
MLRSINGARSMLEACTQIRPEDSVLIVADDAAGPVWLAQVVRSAVEAMGAEAVCMIMNPRELEKREPPPTVAAAMKTADVTFHVTDKRAIVHTTARTEATEAGHKFYLLHQFDVEILKRGISANDIHLIKERTEGLAKRLAETSIARITTPSGTNMTMSLKGRTPLALHPSNPVIGTLPYYGEAAIAPVEGTAEGTVVVDLSILGWDYLLKEPLKYKVKAGRVVDISGDPEEVAKISKIYSTDANANNVAELGIGTSHMIPGEVRGRRIDAARVGTAHFGIGRNNDFGGSTWSAIHLDSLMSKATIELDGTCVIKDGVLL